MDDVRGDRTKFSETPTDANLRSRIQTLIELYRGMLNNPATRAAYKNKGLDDRRFEACLADFETLELLLIIGQEKLLKKGREQLEKIMEKRLAMFKQDYPELDKK